MNLQNEIQTEENSQKNKQISIVEAIVTKLEPIVNYLRVVNVDTIDSIHLESLFKNFNICFNSIDFPNPKVSPKEITIYFNQHSIQNIPDNYNINCEKLYHLLRILMVITSLDIFNSCETIEEMHRALTRGKKFLEAGLLTHIFHLDGWKSFLNPFDWDDIVGWILKIPNIWFTKLYQSYPGEFDAKKAICRQWNSELKLYFDKLQENEIRQEKIYIKNRILPIKEELIAKAMHPKRIERWVELDRWDLFD